jgi:hypothetical protein
MLRIIKTQVIFILCISSILAYTQTSQAAETTATFSYTGALQTWEVPAGVTSVTLKSWGAQGGDGIDIYGGPAAGGLGGYATGDLSVTAGETLNIYVGGAGNTGGTGVGGWNGGGTGSNPYSSGGGGASDVRYGGTALSDRKIVGAGGGGSNHGTYDLDGGDGGGTTGEAGDASSGTAGGGGTQSAGGTSASSAGSLGQGGGTGSWHDSGGGGGYYGGGAADGHAAAGGGSSYITGVTSGSTTAGQRSDHGQIQIVYDDVDSTAPTVTSISSDKTNGSYKAGDVIDIDVTFSEAVTSTGDVTITLETGDTDRTCTFSVSDASTGTCDYTVQAGDTSLDLDATISGTIADGADNPMSNFTSTTGLAANKALVIDSTAPTVTSISSDKTNGSYKAGDVIDIDVTFSEAVTSTGDVTITLETGDTDRTCTFSVSDASTVTCDYTVQAGDTSLDLEASITGTIADAAGNALSDFTPATGLAASKALVVDTSNPTFTSVSASTAESGATITWTTNEGASSMVEYGLTTNFGNITAETDTSPRVTSHSYELSSLYSCANYHYRVSGTDASGNAASSTDTTFITDGCTGSASVTASSTDTVTTAGKTVSLDDGTANISLEVPADFSTTTAEFQLIQISDDDVLAETGNPSDLTAANNHTYSLVALTNLNTAITNFDEAITVTITYDDSEVSSLVESSLVIYRWDGSSWNALTSCSVDESANTVTCQTSNFSTFVLFGEAVSSSSSSTGGRAAPPPPSLGSGSVEKTIPMHDSKVIGELKSDGVNLLLYINSKVEFDNFNLEILNLDMINKKVRLKILNEILELDLYEEISVHNIKIKYNDLLVNRIDLTIEKIKDKSNDLKNNILIKQKNHPAVYLILDNKKHLFLNEAAFLTNGYKWKDIQEVEDLSGVENGDFIHAIKYNLNNKQIIKNNNYIFKYNLAYGAIASDVKILQEYLNNNSFFLTSSGVGSPGNETEYFGELTQQALIKFQQANKISPAVGFFGPITRGFIND